MDCYEEMNNKVRIAFCKIKHGFLDRVITWWTGSKYTHTELVMPGGDWLGVRKGRPWLRRIIPLKIIAVPRDVFNESFWDFIEFEVTDEQLREIWKFYKETEGSRYDWMGMILSHVLNIRIKSTPKWYCSEWVAVALEKAGVLPWDKLRLYNFAGISPGKLYELCSEIKDD